MGSCCCSSSSTKESARSDPYEASPRSGKTNNNNQPGTTGTSEEDEATPNMNQNESGGLSSSSSFHEHQLVINKQYRRLKTSRDPNTYNNSPTSQQPSNTVVSDLFQEGDQSFVRKSVEDSIANEGALFTIIIDADDSDNNNNNNNIIDQHRKSLSVSVVKSNSITASNSVNPNSNTTDDANNNTQPHQSDDSRRSGGAFSFNNSFADNNHEDNNNNNSVVVPSNLAIPSDRAQSNSDGSKSKSSSETRSSGNNNNNNTNNHTESSSLSLKGQKGTPPHAGGVGGGGGGGGSSIVMGNSNNNLHIINYGPGFIPSPFSSPSSTNQQYFGMPPVRSNPNAIGRNSNSNSNNNTGSGGATVVNNNSNNPLRGTERRATMKPPDLQRSDILGPPPPHNGTLKGEWPQRRFGEIQQGSEHLFAPLSLDEGNNNNNNNNNKKNASANKSMMKDSFADVHQRGGPQSMKPANNNNSATVINLDDSINEQQGMEIVGGKLLDTEDNFENDHANDDDEFDRKHQSSNVRGGGKDIQFGALDDSAIRLDIEEAELDGQQAVVDVQSLTLEQYRIYKDHLQKRQLEKEQKRREVIENKKRLNDTQIKPAFDFSGSASASTRDNSERMMPNLRVFSAPPGISPHQNLIRSQHQSYNDHYQNNTNSTEFVTPSSLNSNPDGTRRDSQVPMIAVNSTRTRNNGLFHAQSTSQNDLTVAADDNPTPSRRDSSTAISNNN